MEILLYIAATFGVLYMGTAWSIGMTIYKAGLKAGDFKVGTIENKYEIAMLIFAPIVLPFEIFSNM